MASRRASKPSAPSRRKAEEDRHPVSPLRMDSSGEARWAEGEASLPGRIVNIILWANASRGRYRGQPIRCESIARSLRRAVRHVGRHHAQERNDIAAAYVRAREHQGFWSRDRFRAALPFALPQCADAPLLAQSQLRIRQRKRSSDRRDLSTCLAQLSRTVASRVTTA
jgi:hypothetical protein